MNTIISIYLFVLGVCMGSFALVVAERTLQKKDWVRGRSKCEFCHETLRPYDLVPLFSWLSTGGKCRYCHKKLSVMYPLVELTLGLAFVGSYLALQDSLQGNIAWIQFALWLVGLVLMSVLCIIDAKTMTLPYKFLFPLIGVSVLYAVLQLTRAEDVSSSVMSHLFALVVGAGIFAVLYAVSRGKWIGDSDVLFGIVIALFLGKPLEAWLAIILGCMAGLLYAVFFSIIKKKPMRHAKIPFGPFLIIGLYFSFLFGTQIISWYTETVLFL